MANEKNLNMGFISISMSEELIRKGLKKHGTYIGHYEFYPLGDTTLNQLKQYKIIPDRNYKGYGKRKPDDILVDRTNKKDIKVIVVVEYKDPSKFRTEKEKLEATQQCNDVCQEVQSKVGIITDGQTYIWINPNHIDPNNKYKDRTTEKQRSYSIIRNEDKKDLTEPFLLQKKSESDHEKLEDVTKNTLDYLDRVLSSINEENSTLQLTEKVDPLGLARSVWQDIYVNTGKEPEKCLYNVVELFIFKFLSDLNLLRPPSDFESVYSMYDEGNTTKDVLEYYATNSRRKIVKLFPAGNDKTTIINGTIFVDPNGNPIYSQANLFKNSLKKYEEFGTLRNIKKEFKTKLFETFLKQSHDKSKLGQFFTPRKVVRTMVDMADVEELKSGSRVCDPFCGVGGFIAETIAKPIRKKDFIPKEGKIDLQITYHGYDKGSDEDEERLIILAKANLLIYLSEIIEKYSTITKEFANIFNKMFHFLTESNLGTLNIIIEKEEEKYDLILTNPPYITSGSKSIKEEIKSEGLQQHYTCNGKGVDSLALEWIVRSLKKGGRAFIIVSDGILQVTQNERLRKFIREECFINCIISLPIKTFFNTPQKTYILGITKKQDKNIEQDFPVFTYLVSDIGETLDVYRFETEGKSDLEKAKEFFNSYKGSPKTFPIVEIKDKRCKLQPFKKFVKSEDWVIDRWWTRGEKIELGILEEEKILTLNEFKEEIDEITKKLQSYQEILGGLQK